MVAKFFQWLLRARTFIILYLILIGSLAAGFYLLYSYQKPLLYKKAIHKNLVFYSLNDSSLLPIKDFSPKAQQAKDNIQPKLPVGDNKEQKSNNFNNPPTQVPKHQHNDKVISTTLLNNPETNGDLEAAHPKIALLIGGLGLSKQETIAALQMDSRIGLGFSPYGQDAGAWVNQAVSNGYEVYINIPMQPLEYPNNDPGPLALLNNLTPRENITRLTEILSKSIRLKGVYSDSKEDFTSFKDSILPILTVIKQRGLAYIYGKDASNGILEEQVRKLELDYLNVDVIIDEEPDPEDVKSNLLRLENIAKTKGLAIGKFHPYPMSIKIINQWILGLNKNEVMLVPPSQLFKIRKDLIKEEANNNVDHRNNKQSQHTKTENNVSSKIYSKDEYNKYFNSSNKVVYVSENGQESPNPPMIKEEEDDILPEAKK